MPTGKPNAFAVPVLQKHGIETGFARSKSWDEFADSQEIKMYLIITVCDNAADDIFQSGQVSRSQLTGALLTLPLSPALMKKLLAPLL